MKFAILALAISALFLSSDSVDEARAGFASLSLDPVTHMIPPEEPPGSAMYDALTGEE